MKSRTFAELLLFLGLVLTVATPAEAQSPFWRWVRHVFPFVARYTDNGDGTITDTTTGLMWEIKDDSGGIHDKDNIYTFTTDIPGSAPNGTAFTVFLAALNDCWANDVNRTFAAPPTMKGGFAGHCDWRLPTIAELWTLRLGTYPCASPCIDGAFGPTSDSYYLTSGGGIPMSNDVWLMRFADGDVNSLSKSAPLTVVRAVRGP